MTADQGLSARLDPCQFCGGYCSEIADVSVAEYPHPKFQVQCVACGLSGPIAPSENEAAKLWNLVHTNHERAVQAAVEKAVDAERARTHAVRMKLDSRIRNQRRELAFWGYCFTDQVWGVLRGKGIVGAEDRKRVTRLWLDREARRTAAIRSRGVEG